MFVVFHRRIREDYQDEFWASSTGFSWVCRNIRGQSWSHNLLTCHVLPYSTACWRAQLSIQSSKPKFWGDFWLLSFKKKSIRHHPANVIKSLPPRVSQMCSHCPNPLYRHPCPISGTHHLFPGRLCPPPHSLSCSLSFLPHVHSLHHDQSQRVMGNISDCGTAEPKTRQLFPHDITVVLHKVT